jgi:hypothetical protein
LKAEIEKKSGEDRTKLFQEISNSLISQLWSEE